MYLDFFLKFFKVIFIFILLIPLDIRAEEIVSSPQTKKSNNIGSDFIIRNITVKLSDIFEDESKGLFYKTANNLKISTKEDVIKRELLFKEGDSYSHFLLHESERNLRQLPFLRNAQIQPTFEGNFVDIEVIVQDTWTIFPFLSFALGGGANKQTFGVAETNLLGLGKRVEALYSLDEGRQKTEAVFEDRRLFGSYEQLTLGVFDRTDGYRAVGFYGRPFRSLIEKKAWSLDTDFSDLVGKLYEDGDESFIYRRKQQAFSAGFTFAKPEEGLVAHRLTFGYDYSSSKFQQATDKDFQDVDLDPNEVSNDPALLADDRTFSGPYTALQIIEPDFVSMAFLDRFDRVEDYNLGNEFLARATFAAEALGSTSDTILFGFSDSDGLSLSESSFLRGKAGVTSRMNTDGFENSLISADVRYYNCLGEKYFSGVYLGKHTFVTSLSLDFGDRFDKDRQLILGAGSGLRGYDERAFTGEQSFLLNIEERSYLIEDLYKLVSVGTALFFDVGGISNQGLGDIVTDTLHADVGFGFRFGFPRSSGGSLVRVDLAFPVSNADDGTKAWEPRLLITAGQAVSARLPDESQQAPGSNVSLKFLP